MAPSVWLITGAQGSGKSTIADLLARRFERGAHVRGGQFYRWAVSGWVHFDDEAQPDEARRLLGLRYQLSAQVAALYTDDGFTCVVQDNIYGQDVMTWIGDVLPRMTHLVVLRPSVEVVAAKGRGPQTHHWQGGVPGRLHCLAQRRALDCDPTPPRPLARYLPADSAGDGG